MYHHQQRCAYIISPQTSNHFSTNPSLCVSKIYSIHSPSWRRYPFSSHITTKSKISTSPVKKLVAATDDVYASIHFYNLAIASVTPGAVRPRAIYHDYAIYNPTNNAVCIKYLAQKPHTIFRPIFAMRTLEISPPILPLGGDTPFYLISQRNRRFLFDG